MELIRLGWTEFFSASNDVVDDDLSFPCRISSVNRNSVAIICEHGQFSATVTGKVKQEFSLTGQRLAVGDWVLGHLIVQTGSILIHKLLPRKTCLSRQAPNPKGRKSARPGVESRFTKPQIVAANIDIVFIVEGLDENFSPRRIERFLTLVWQSGAMPVVILNKADLHSNPDAVVASLKQVALGVPVHLVSAVDNVGIQHLLKYLGLGMTAALVGSSGVGKSSIINALLGEKRFRTGVVKANSKGRHTTTSRELILLARGGVLIDNPGIRELQLWAEEDDLDSTFPELQAFEENCQFRNCSHRKEIGCAVRQAVDLGMIPIERYESYLKLKSEVDVVGFAVSEKAVLKHQAKRRRDGIAVALRAKGKR